MRYSDKDIIVISVCLLTLTVAIVMYIALCVYNVLRRRGKLRGDGRLGVIFIRHGGERRHGKKTSLADLKNTADEKPVVWTPPPPPPPLDLPYITASIPYEGKKKSLADLINTADEKPVVWTPPPPPPPPDPPNPDF